MTPTIPTNADGSPRVVLDAVVSTCPCGDDHETETDEPDFTLDDLEWSEKYE